jgi:hypothetical protein
MQPITHKTSIESKASLKFVLHCVYKPIEGVVDKSPRSIVPEKEAKNAE